MNAILRAKFKKISRIVAEINSNMTLLNSRITSLQDEVTTMSKYLSEVSMIARDKNNNLPLYKPMKFGKIKIVEKMEEINEEEKSPEYMSSKDINDVLRNIKKDINDVFKKEKK